MTPFDPADAALMQKIPVPPEILEWAKATADDEDVVALLAEAQARGGFGIDDLLPELDAIAAAGE